jgi:hypothetical protein
MSIELDIARVKDNKRESAITAGRNNMATVNAISPDGMQIRYQFQVR